MKAVYLDHAATTPVARVVLETMAPYFRAYYGNPSSIHEPGYQARDAVDRARASVGSLLKCTPQEILFTSGGTESDNLAVIGSAWAQENKRHIITSSVEHHAVLRSCQWLESQGWRVTYLPVDSAGLVDPDQLHDAICSDTGLVSIMHANNEVGTIQPIQEIAAICRTAGVRFHTDAVQTFGHVPISVDELGVDMLSLSGHKFYGPKGTGALYVRRGVHVAPIIHGGGHERGRRSGTENVPGIAGLGRASELAIEEMADQSARQILLRDRLIEGVTSCIQGSLVTGHRERRLPGIASFIIGDVDGDSLLHQLDAVGIAASSGSACTSGSLEPSHVLLAMGITPNDAFGSLRFSLGRDTTDADIDYVLECIPRVVESARESWDGVFGCDCLDGECL